MTDGRGPGTMPSVASLLADAHRLAGQKAVEADALALYMRAREWKALAVEIQALMRDAVELMADA